MPSTAQQIQQTNGSAIPPVEVINPLAAENESLKAALREAVENLAKAPKPFDTFLSIEHQSRLAVKYDAKYSAADKEVHAKNWPEFTGNKHLMYILAEATLEAQKAVFSANRITLVGSVTAALANYTPAVNGAVLTEMQVTFNKMTDANLVIVKSQIPGDEQVTDLLKVISKNLHTAAKTGKELDSNKEKFFHAALALGCKTPSTLW